MREEKEERERVEREANAEWKRVFERQRTISYPHLIQSVRYQKGRTFLKRNREREQAKKEAREREER